MLNVRSSTVAEDTRNEAARVREDYGRRRSMHGCISDKTNLLTIICLPKSAQVYFQRSIEATLSAVKWPLSYPSANVKAEIIAEAISRYTEQPCALAGDHIPASEHNLRMLAAAGIERIALLVRDPRDALVSWWHHLERDDIKGEAWIAARLSSSGLMSEGYCGLSLEERLADLIEHMFPAMQEWLTGWGSAMERDSPFSFHVSRFEDFVRDPAQSLRNMCRFFGHDVEPVLPEREGPAEQFSAGIHTFTHFRRGVAGSHRDEVPAHLLPRLSALTDRSVFERYGWSLDH